MTVVLLNKNKLQQFMIIHDNLYTGGVYMDYLVRLLNADEIECRVSYINEKGLSLLLYKDARVDQKILDETFGAFGWKRSHQCIDGNLYCTVEVFDRKTGEWISKQDVGTTGLTEKEKSQASDSFKRACFNWGIGRELYSAPFIWVPADKADIQKRDGKLYCSSRFSVKLIGYNDNREIASLTIVNEKGYIVYERITEDTKSDKDEMVISKSQMKSLETELKRTGVTMEDVMNRYNIQKPAQISSELYDRAMRALARTKSAESARTA